MPEPRAGGASPLPRPPAPPPPAPAIPDPAAAAPHPSARVVLPRAAESCLPATAAFPHVPAPLFGRRAALLSLLALAACGGGGQMRSGQTGRLGGSGLHPNETPLIRQRITYWARHYDVPATLVQRVVRAESAHRPEARNGAHLGLMQLSLETARVMGYRGPAEGLLDPDTNLRYGVRYLRGAWMVAGGDPDRAVMWYRRGYYDEAKRRGLLTRTGLAG